MDNTSASTSTTTSEASPTVKVTSNGHCSSGSAVAGTHRKDSSESSSSTCSSSNSPNNYNHCETVASNNQCDSGYSSANTTPTTALQEEEVSVESTILSKSSFISSFFFLLRSRKLYGIHSNGSSNGAAYNAVISSPSLTPSLPSSSTARKYLSMASTGNVLCSIRTNLYRSKHYLSSLRPGSFVISLIPVLLGALLAAKTTGQFSVVILFATLLTVLSVHAAGNLVNTYCDFVRGIDSKERRSDDRTLVDSILTPEEVVNLGMFCQILRTC